MVQSEKDQIIVAIIELLKDYAGILETVPLASLSAAGADIHKQHTSRAAEMLGYAESRNSTELRKVLDKEVPKEKWEYFDVPRKYPRSRLITISEDLKVYEKYDTDLAVKLRALRKQQAGQDITETEKQNKHYSCDVAGIADFIRDIRSPIFKYKTVTLTDVDSFDFPDGLSLRQNFDEQAYTLAGESEKAFLKYGEKDPACVKHLGNAIASLGLLMRCMNYKPAKLLANDLGKLNTAWVQEFNMTPGIFKKHSDS